MYVQHLTPILNVSSIEESLLWFQKWGWEALWEWGEPAAFGAVGSGQCEIFLCQNGQGGRGRGQNSSTFGPGGDETQDRGVWMSVWVLDVDAVYAQAVAAGIEVVFPPEDMPWSTRECHLRHPDGHIFRVSTGLETE
jgi:catechol 2,3-dioxygenase-like lactoylglutathione lyase family enzyme